MSSSSTPADPFDAYLAARTGRTTAEVTELLDTSDAEKNEPATPATSSPQHAELAKEIRRIAHTVERTPEGDEPNYWADMGRGEPNHEKAARSLYGASKSLAEGKISRASDQLSNAYAWTRRTAALQAEIMKCMDVLNS